MQITQHQQSKSIKGQSASEQKLNQEKHKPSMWFMVLLQDQTQWNHCQIIDGFYSRSLGSSSSTGLSVSKHNQN